MEHSTFLLWRWTGILLLAGGIIFWIGAFTPPYKQWMTRDIKEYLTIIHNNKVNWYIISGSFLIGVILTVIGMQIWSLALQQAGQKNLPVIAANIISFGAVFWILNIAFRLTVTVWAADQLASTQQPDPSF